MITLVQYPHSKSRPSISPYCLKLETYFKVVNQLASQQGKPAPIEYKNSYSVSNQKYRKKKFPVIESNGQIVEDSTLIIQHLKDTQKLDLDSGLTPEEKAQSLAFQWLIEKHLTEVLVYYRWIYDGNWPKFRDAVFGKAPFIIKIVFGFLLQKNVRKVLNGNGMGRFSDQEKIYFFERDIRALSDFLGKKNFFFGDRPSTLDAVAFGALAQLTLNGNLTPELYQIVNQFPNLSAFVDRMHKTFWENSWTKPD